MIPYSPVNRGKYRIESKNQDWFKVFGAKALLDELCGMFTFAFVILTEYLILIRSIESALYSTRIFDS
jgi:hypothetical protein